MSRFMFTIGFLISAALHAFLLLGWPPDFEGLSPENAEHERATIQTVQIASVDKSKMFEPEPEPEQTPEPEPEPKPEPRPEPKPESKPEPKPESKPIPEPQPKPQPAPRPDPKPSNANLNQYASASKTDLGPGDFAGAREGQRLPRLLIDWGSAQHARDVLKAGGMKLVILDSSNSGARVRQQVAQVGNQFRLLPFDDESSDYSNRLRVIRNVPAFAHVNRALNLSAKQDLAVALPVALERSIDHTKKIAATDANIPYLGVEHFRGRFRLLRGQLRFQIVHVQRRAG